MEENSALNLHQDITAFTSSEEEDEVFLDEKDCQQSLPSRKRPTPRKGPAKNTTIEYGYQAKRKVKFHMKDTLSTETRGEQIKKELMKHSLSDEVFNSLLKDLAEPLDITGIILNMIIEEEKSKLC